ncbi:MAG: TonB-dependent receptor plug domain-containing protein [Bacteroidales bacterium]|nr:TonB-dependent receptor plug domain-containing protein [Bacteroidales bacterium]
MKKFFVAAAVAALVSPAAFAQEADSLKSEELQEIIISAVRAQKNAPYAVSRVGRSELGDASASGRELPLLFASTPGVIAWSENGVGTGTTYMRIRGAGGSRINVTIDGIPLNSPEDQTVFWANMNSYGSLLGSVQIQRGVGASTNGDGAFGGTVSLATKAPSLIPEAELTTSFGSFNTFHAGGSVSTGLLWNHLVLEGAYNETSTDGYMHGTDGRSGSYTGSATWMGRGWKLAYRLLGNFENTGQAWNGVTAGNGSLSLMDGCYCDAGWGYDQKTGIKTYKDICEFGLGQFNSLYEYLQTDANGLLVKEDGKYLTSRYKMNDGTLWPRTTDNFWQNHHIVSFSLAATDALRFSLSARYTGGYGYYEEFRQKNKLVKFGIPVFTGANGLVEKSDFVRRKGLSQDTWGTVASASYRKGPWYVVGGLSLQWFDCTHFGKLTYASNEELAARILADGWYKYYDSPASKNDGSGFLKASFALSEQWSVFGDLQLRRVHYKTWGYNDKYIDNGNGTATRHDLDIDKTWNFFNPKAGVSFTSGAHRAYASAAVAGREPERNNFTDNGHNPAPKAERLYDFEAGYSVAARIWRAGVGLYYMRYDDQLVQTGELSDIGEALTTNIPDSYRAGLELTGGVDALSWLSFEANAALSRNRILDFDEYVEDWDNGVSVFHYDDKPLAFSPSAILNGFVNFRYKGFKAVWHTSYVSRMYLDNSGNGDRSLPGYSLSELSFSYKFKFPRFLREAEVGLDLHNIFSAQVAQSGWVYSAIAGSLGHPNGNRYYQLGFIPVAPLSASARLALRF